MESSRSSHNGSPEHRFHPTVPDWREREREVADTNRANMMASERARTRFVIRTVILCWLGVMIGAIPMAWAFHTTNMEQAQLAFAAGQALGPGIVVAVLIHAAIRWDQDEW